MALLPDLPFPERSDAGCHGSDLAAFFREAETAGLLASTAAVRLEECRRDLAAGRPAALSEAELAFGARVAWRNQARCIGRLHWRSLQVSDRRDCTDLPDVVAALCEHVACSTADGAVRPFMTVFAPAEPGRRGITMRNRQLAGYAGYLRNGSVLGDPLNVELTAEAIALGWTPPGSLTAFDLLPWILVGEDGRPVLVPLPPGLIREIPLSHPAWPAFADLGLRWYAVPVVTDLAFRVAGTVFPFAPFSGWYMGTEIACRNLGDENRYNVLPAVARVMGLDTVSKSVLWKDRALIELNTAVLHSFGAAGCRIVDHHTASAEFMRFCGAEKKAGRPVSARWDWIVPPLSGSVTPVFHLPMTDLGLRPEFFRPE
ncbi:MAG: hypothetical protein B9S34_13605 [Opitutia bacterium Tous-C1TDCM]|nr:MAG: hypothetical protein B9S34_13605 [Opitutae bacterium Tous-C1TDCM]